MVRTADPDLRLLAALADPVRFAIVRRLATSDSICACDFTDVVAVSQPTVSHHLRVLREAGVVTSERRGSWIWYRLSADAIGRLSSLARGLVPGNPAPAAELVRIRRPRSGTAVPLAQASETPRATSS